MMQNSKPQLKREIGATGLALNGINLTIGSGIFVLPALIALKLGAASFVAYLFCGVLVVLVMLCFAEVGSKVTSSGGSYAYVEKAFGPLPGFLINTTAWFGFSALADAAVVNAIADILVLWMPVFSNSLVRVVFFIVVFGSLAWVNVKGVKNGSQFAATATILKLAPLLLLILIGLFSIKFENLAVTNWPTITDMGEASLLLFFAFVGSETALSIGGEIKDPQRNIPKGIFMAVTGILIVYLLIQLVAQGVMGTALASYQEAPLAAVASKLVGSVGSTVIIVTALVSMFGLLCGDILASPRILFAAAADKLLPDFLGRVHPKYATPYMAIIFYTVICAVMASSGSFKQLAVLASSSILLVYLAVVLATIRLRYKEMEIDKPGFKIPGGLLVPVLALIAIGWFLLHVTKTEIIGFAIFFASLTAYFVINKQLRKIKNVKLD